MDDLVAVEIMLDNESYARMEFLPSDRLLETYAQNNPDAQDLTYEFGLANADYDPLSLALFEGHDKVAEVLFGMFGSLPPILVAWPEARKVVCGVNNNVVILSCREPKLKYLHSVGQIITFLFSSDREFLLYWEELGITCFDRMSNEIWYWYADNHVIEHVRVEEHAVVIKLLNVGTTRLDIHTGKHTDTKQ